MAREHSRTSTKEQYYICGRGGWVVEAVELGLSRPLAAFRNTTRKLNHHNAQVVHYTSNVIVVGCELRQGVRGTRQLGSEAARHHDGQRKATISQLSLDVHFVFIVYSIVLYVCILHWKCAIHFNLLYSVLHRLMLS